jgi:hypothetical protein
MFLKDYTFQTPSIWNDLNVMSFTVEDLTGSFRRIRLL